MMDEPIPKTKWGPGPWQDEPDHLDWIDERTGLSCKIVRNMFTGNLCGYVGVPPMHPYFGWSYDDDIEIKPGDIDGLRIGADVGYVETFIYALEGGTEHGTIPLGMTLRAHCGVNFSQEVRNGDGLWWLGFDCGHCNDVMPAMDARMERIMPPDERAERKRLFAHNKYRTVDYVRKEVTALAFQLRQLETRVLLDEGVLKFCKGAT